MGEDDPAPTPAPAAWLAPRWRTGILAVLGVLFFAIGLHQASRDAPTVDEGVDVSSGVTSLVRHDLRLNPEHPALPKAVAALPALLAHPKAPDTAAYRSGDWFDYSDDFISANEAAGRLRPMLTWARAVVLVEALGCAVLLYRLGRRFFGPDGGALAAAAWLTTPYVVGFGHFAMVDVPFTLAVLATSVVLAWWRDAPSLARAAGVGLVLGAALASRHTALVLILVAVVVMASALRRVPRDAAIQVLLAGVTSVAVVAGWGLVVWRRRRWVSIVPVVVAPAVLLWLFLLTQPLNLGLRLVCPRWRSPWWVWGPSYRRGRGPLRPGPPLAVGETSWLRPSCAPGRRPGGFPGDVGALLIRVDPATVAAGLPVGEWR